MKITEIEVVDPGSVVAYENSHGCLNGWLDVASWSQCK